MQPNICKYVSYSLHFNPYENEIIDVEAETAITGDIVENPNRRISNGKERNYETLRESFRDDFHFSSPYYNDNNPVEEHSKEIFEEKNNVA